jgi:SecD/SecF fusion protein
MEGLTSINLPDERRGTYRLLGIVLDGTLLSAPRVMSTISGSGRITGQFTPEEVDFIVGVLQAGSLPVDLGDAPITEVSFGPNEAWRQTLVSTVLATLGLLLVIWSLALARSRVLGLAAAWSNLLQLLLMLAGLEVVRLPLTMPTVLAAAALLLVAAVGNGWICESVHRAKRQGNIPPGPVGRSLVVRAGLLAALLGILWLASVFVYLLCDAPLRSTAAIVNLGSVAAVATSCLCLPFLILAARWPDPTREADVVAELVDSSGPLNG